MKKIFTFLILFSFAFTFNSCKDEIETSDLKFASFKEKEMNVGVADGSESNPVIKFYTTNTSSSERQFNIEVVEGSTADAGFYNVPATVTIPAGSNEGSINISVTDGAWLDSDQSLNLKLVSSESNQFIGDDLNITLYRLCPGANETKVKFSIEFDTYPEEVYWRLWGPNGTIVQASQASPGYGAYAGMSGSLEFGFCLPSGTYTLQVFDQYQDGAGALSFQTYDGITLFSTDGSYGAGVTAEFTL